jgi:hypothetical protein
MNRMPTFSRPVVTASTYKIWIFLGLLALAVVGYFWGGLWYEYYRMQVLQLWPEESGTQILGRRVNEIRAAFQSDPNQHLDSRQIAKIELFIHDDDFRKLNSNLPRSGKNYVTAYLKENSTRHRVKVRYRGDNGYHWFYPKRSFKIKTRKDRLLFGTRQITLYNVKDTSFLSDYYSFKLSRKMGLLSPYPRMANLVINGKYQGLYALILETDESFLRQNRQMPGTIFFGDPSDSLGIDYVFHQLPWQKEALHSNDTETDFSQLQPLFAAIYDETLPIFELLDYDYYTRFLSFVDLWGVAHYATTHNHKIFLDPLDGKFRHISWDNVFIGQAPASAIDVANNELFLRLMREPQFIFDKYQFLHHFLKSEQDKTLFDIGFIEENRKYADNDFKDKASFNFPINPIYDVGNKDRDPLFAQNKDLLDRFLSLFSPQIEAPQSFSQGVYTLYRNYITRRSNVLYALNQSSVTYAYADSYLKINVSGVPSVKDIKIFTCDKLNGFIFRDVNQNGLLDPKERHRSNAISVEKLKDGYRLQQLLHPGRLIHYLNQDYIKFDIEPAALCYGFFLPQHIEISKIEATNAITGKKVAIPVTSDWRVPTVDSRHPWMHPIASPTSSVIISEDTVITADLFIESTQMLIIEPGVTVRLGQGISIISQGPIIMNGTQPHPIRILPVDDRKPWGVIAAIGPAAHGSRFSHTVFSMGSHKKHQQLYFPGMLSIHYASADIEHCLFENNVLGDDALRAAKSRVNVSCSRFSNVNGDAIDFDYSFGTIAGNQFDQSGNDGIDLMNSDPVIVDNKIRFSKDKGISVGEKSNPVIASNLIENNHIGLQTKDGSCPIVLDSAFLGNQVAISAIKKNWRYGEFGTGLFLNTNFSGNQKLIEKDDGAAVFIYNSLLNGQKSSRFLYQKQFELLRELAGFSPKAANLTPAEHEIIVHAKFENEFLHGTGEWTAKDPARIYRHRDHLVAKFKTASDYLSKPVAVSSRKLYTKLIAHLTLKGKTAGQMEILFRDTKNSTHRFERKVLPEKSHYFFLIPISGLNQIALKAQPNTLSIYELKIVGIP